MFTYVPLAYYAPRCVLCDRSCRFTPTVKLPTPIKSPTSGRKRFCAHADCLVKAWEKGSPLTLPTLAELEAEQKAYAAARTKAGGRAQEDPGTPLKTQEIRP